MRYFKDEKPKYTIEYNEAVELVQKCHEIGNYSFKEKDIMELTKGIVFDGDIIGYLPQEPTKSFTYPFIDRNIIYINTPSGCMSIFAGSPSCYSFTIYKETSKGNYQITIDCSNSIGQNLDMDITTQKNDEEKYRIRFSPYMSSEPSCYLISSDDLIKIEDVFKLCNILFHADVTKIYDSIHSSYKSEFPSIAKQLIIEAENKEKNIETMPNLFSDTSLGLSGDNVEEIFNILVRLKSRGIQLSSEQEDFVKKYNKIEEYRDRKPQIEEKQRLLREKIASENERKYAWWLNPNNPSNLHRNELDKKIAEAESEIRELEEIQRFGFQLTFHQEHLLKGNKLFIQNATSEDRDVTQNMQQQVVEWYQDEYTDTRVRK